MNSIRLIESFKKEVQSHLTSKNIAFCNNIISSGIGDKEKEDMITYYLEDLKKAGASFSKITDPANRIDIYLTVHQSLLFSYDLPSFDSLKIPSKYYALAPLNFESLLIALPNSKIIVKAEYFSKKMGYGSRFDKTGNLVCIKTYFNKSKDEWILLQDSSFIDTYYPHFSISRPSYCNAYIGTTINTYFGNIPIPIFPEECKMSQNREHICEREQALHEYYGSALLSDYYALVMMCFDKWKNRPVRTNTSKSKKYDDCGISTIFIQTPPNQTTQKKVSNFKEVPLRECANYISTMRSRGWKVINRLSPCEHIRREHTRHLKSGKIITARSPIVNKGNTRAIYQIKK